MLKYASAEEGAAKIKQKTTVRHFDFTEKVYRLPCTVRIVIVEKCHRGNVVNAAP